MKKIVIALFLCAYSLVIQAQIVSNDVAFVTQNKLYHIEIEGEYEGCIEERGLVGGERNVFNMPFYIAPDYINNRLVWGIYDENAYGITIINSKTQPFVGLRYLVKIPLEDLEKVNHINSNFLKFLPKSEYSYSSVPLFQFTGMSFDSVSYFYDFTVLSDEKLYFFIQVDYQIHLLEFDGEIWKKLACYDTDFNGIFNAIQLCGTVYIIDNEGITYTLEDDKLVKQNTKVLKNRADNVLVIDKDAQTLSYIKKSNLQEKNGRELKELIERNRVKLPHE
ncbi:MAG: hypothetical protein AB8B69_17690 [Chitinophagales bacterium]